MFDYMLKLRIVIVLTLHGCVLILRLCLSCDLVLHIWCGRQSTGGNDLAVVVVLSCMLCC